jgi:DNA-binding response OmpR family regulator
MLKRILVLDNNPDILDTIKEVLLYEKFEVKIMSSDDHILDTIATFHPDLVMLDYKQSGPKGDAICRQIKTHPQFFNIPVVLCSAYLNNDQDVLSCGCDAIITKPFGIQELVDKVNGLLGVENIH